MDKKITIGINGCGITGLSVARAILQRNDVELVAINTLRDASDLASDFKVDTGISKGPSRYNFSDKGVLYFDKKPPVTVLNFPNKPPVTVFHEKDPANIPWDSAGVDIVVESSDLLTNKFDAAAHLKGGAMKVIISGGSMLASMATKQKTLKSIEVIKNRFFFSEALVTNVPTITANRQTVYGPAASFNTIPRSTSATETEVFGYVFPSLSGKLNVFQFSLPTVGVSAVDLTIRLEKAATYDDIKKAFKEESEGNMKGILGYTEDDVVSTDFLGDKRSCIFDAKAGVALNDKIVKLVSWYDDMWGYCSRIVDLVVSIPLPDTPMELTSVECGMIAKPSAPGRRMSSVAINFNTSREVVYMKPNGLETVKQFRRVISTQKYQYGMRRGQDVGQTLRYKKLNVNTWLSRRIVSVVSAKATAMSMRDDVAYKIRVDIDLVFKKRYPNDVEKDDGNCLICRGELSGAGCRVIQCGHAYHKRCLNSWLVHYKSCPFCRVLTY